MYTDNFIVVENVTEQDISKVLSNLSNLYLDTGYTDSIELLRSTLRERTFLVHFPNNPDFERFAYFVNYIRYPENIEAPGISPVGLFHVSESARVDKFNKGQWLKLYIAKNDTEYDNVSLVTDNNDSYLFDFGGNFKKLNSAAQTFSFPISDNSEFVRITLIKPEPKSNDLNTDDRADKPWWKFW